MSRTLISACAVLCVFFMPGCFVGALIGGAAQNAEYQKLKEVLPEYAGLENKTVAVVVNTDLATRYEHPELARQLAVGLSMRLQNYVPGIRVMNPDSILSWQFNTSQWSAMPYGDLATELEVERIVYVDLYEYRLHPSGNSWIWEGVCASTIGIIERDYIDPDNFAYVVDKTTQFPPNHNVTRDEMKMQQVQYGLVSTFIRDAAWLFYRHIEPKYPDKYQGSIPENL